MKLPTRAVFFTLDGLRSTPQDIGPFNPGQRYLRPVYRRVVSEFSVKEARYNYSPDFELREYEYTKTVEWFDGEPMAYFCEVKK